MPYKRFHYMLVRKYVCYVYTYVHMYVCTYILCVLCRFIILSVYVRSCMYCVTHRIGIIIDVSQIVYKLSAVLSASAVFRDCNSAINDVITRSQQVQLV